MYAPNGRPKMSPLFLLLAVITLALASFGYFRLFVDFADMPGWLAILAVGGLDISAVLLGKHALTVAEDGDSSAPWNAALLGINGLGAFAQFSHALLAGQPVTIGIVSAAFPVVTVLLFEGQLRRVYRLNGRAAGRLSHPRATVDLMTWLLYRRLAMRATRLAVLDRGLDSDSALTIAERQLSIELAQTTRPRGRRTLRRTYAAELAGDAVTEIDGPDVPTHLPPPVRTPAIRPDDNPDNPPDNGGQRRTMGGCVYVLDVLQDGETVPGYVGYTRQALKEREGQHRSRQPWADSIIGSARVLFEADNVSDAELSDEERKWISELRPLHNKLKLTMPARIVSSDNGTEPTSNPNPPDIRQRGDLARAVGEATEVVGTDPDAVIAAVRWRYPDADRDTIRRTLARHRTG